MRYLLRHDKNIYVKGVDPQFYLPTNFSFVASFMLKKLSHSIIGQILFSSLIACIFFVLGLTVKWRHENLHVYQLVKERKKPYIIISWHEHILGMTCCLPRPITTLNSPHSDGKILGKAVQMVGLNVIWGSSNKQALSSLRELANVLRQGHNVGITPDGPRGPARTLAMGPVALAHMSNIEIIPVVFATDRQWCLKSWDKTRIPKPFSNAVILWGEPISLDKLNRDKKAEHLDVSNVFGKKVSKQMLESWRHLIEDSLNELTHKCDALVANRIKPKFGQKRS